MVANLLTKCLIFAKLNLRLTKKKLHFFLQTEKKMQTLVQLVLYFRYLQEIVFKHI
jgi:hypothetical protein